MKKDLIIISLLDGKGPTGVEVHFNELIREARSHGVAGQSISPYPSRRLWAKFAKLFMRIVSHFDKERAAIFDRWTDRKVLESKLNAALSTRANKSVPLTLYAQDTLSTQVALKARKRHGCRIVSVIHYNVSEAYELFLKGEAKIDGPLWRYVMATEHETLPQVDQLIFVSDFMRKVVLDRLPKCAGVPQTVIPNFVSEPNVAGERLPIDADMIAIGTLEPRKNQAFLLHVLARTNDLGRRYTMTVVGNGPDREILQELAKVLGIENQVRFAGFQKNAARLIPRHRVLVHAARIENMPITLIEALALGKPILAPAVGGITEIFNHGVEGYYWSLDDVDSAAGLLVQMLSDREAYERMVQAALIRYQKNFNSTLLIDHWLETIFDHGISPPVSRREARLS